MKPWIIACGLAVIAQLAGCQGDPTGGSVDGREIYAKLCTTCHGATGRPSAAMAARLGVRDLRAPDLRARISPALVEKQIRRGSDNRLMPAFEGALTDAQIKAVAAWVAGEDFLAQP